MAKDKKPNENTTTETAAPQADSEGMTAVESSYKMLDANKQPLLDDEGKPRYAKQSAKINWGGNLGGLVAKCNGDEDVVYSNAVANLTVVLQSKMRAAHKAGMTPEQIQQMVDSWVPGAVAPKIVADPIAAAKQAMAGWSDAQIKEFLADLKK
jgi:hypothetical protein